MNLVKGLSETSLLEKIRFCCRLAAVGERALGFYLRDLEVRGLCRKLGFSSIVQLALLRYHIPEKKTRELLRIARALEELPLINQAFAAGEISWSAVREITRVAVEQTEQEWLEFGQENNLRRVERAVAQTRRGDRPPKDALGLTKTKLRVVAELFLEDHALWQAACDRIAATHGIDLEAGTALMVLAKSYLEKPLDKEEARARRAFQVVYHRCVECNRAWVETEDGPEAVPVEVVAAREPYARVIRLDEAEERKAATVAEAPAAGGGNGSEEAPAAGRGNGAAAVVAGSEAIVPAAGGGNERAAAPGSAGGGNGASASPRGAGGSDSAASPRGAGGGPGSTGGIGPTCGQAEGETTSGTGGNGAGHAPRGADSELVVPKAERDEPNPFLLRQQVLSRDGRICQVPGCRNRAYLSSHHVVFRSHGGATALANEVAVCSSCHSLIHEGSLRVVGRAPHGLEWLGPDGKPLAAAVNAQGTIQLDVREGAAVAKDAQATTEPAEPQQG